MSGGVNVGASPTLNINGTKIYPVTDSTTGVQFTESTGNTSILNIDTRSSTSTFTGALSVGTATAPPSSGLLVGGNSVFNGYISVGSSAGVVGAFNVAGATTLSGTVAVGNSSNISGLNYHKTLIIPNPNDYFTNVSSYVKGPYVPASMQITATRVSTDATPSTSIDLHMAYSSSAIGYGNSTTLSDLSTSTGSKIDAASYNIAVGNTLFWFMNSAPPSNIKQLNIDWDEDKN